MSAQTAFVGVLVGGFFLAVFGTWFVGRAKRNQPDDPSNQD